jgi:hypothetical protein
VEPIGSVLTTEQHGSDASEEAAKRADALLDNGDLKASAKWLGVLLAIEPLPSDKPEPGETVQ